MFSSRAKGLNIFLDNVMLLTDTYNYCCVIDWYLQLYLCYWLIPTPIVLLTDTYNYCCVIDWYLNLLLCYWLIPTPIVLLTDTYTYCCYWLILTPIVVIDWYLHLFFREIFLLTPLKFSGSNYINHNCFLFSLYVTLGLSHTTAAANTEGFC